MFQHHLLTCHRDGATITDEHARDAGRKTGGNRGSGVSMGVEKLSEVNTRAISGG